MRTSGARRRRAATVIASVVLLAFAAHGAAWFIACRRLEQGAADAVIQARAEGWAVSSGAPRRAGWPLAAEIDYPDLVVAGGPESFPPELTWRAEALRLRLSLAAPATLVVEPAGRQTLQAAGLPALPFSARRMALSLPLTSGAPPTAAIDALTASVGGGALTVHDAALTFPARAASAELHGIGLPAGAPPIDLFRADAAMTRPVPPGATPAERARAWRDAGGSVALSNAALRWGKLEASGSGTLGLDDQLQPRAEGTIEATGLPAALDELARSGALPPAAATAAKAVVAILAAPAPGAPVRLPIELRDGRLAVAHFPLLRFPLLEWE